MQTDTLTREQIMAMPAGAEMDALIATRVTGKTLPERWLHQFVERRPYDYVCLSCGRGIEEDKATPAPCRPFIKRYSTDANAMLEVIENRLRAGYEPTMRLRPDLNDWWVDFQDQRGFSHASYNCDDLIVSVCRAALLTTLETA